MRALAVIVAALTVAAVAHGAVHYSTDGQTLTLTARMQTAGDYAASCTVDGLNIGTSLLPSRLNGKVSIAVPLFGHSGDFTCSIRSGPDFGSPPAPLRNGRPATVTGTV